MRKKRTYCRLDWDQWFSFASDYYLAYGDLLIEGTYRTVGGYRLGRWIERQRAMYNGVITSTLTEERIEALESIGMIWKLEYRSSWDCWMDEVKKYYEEHGDLNVPRNYRNGIYCLGNWIDEQRKRYSKDMLSKEKIQSLEKYGMVWYEFKHRKWDDWYRDAAEYYRGHGNLLVPLSYKTEEGRCLGRWISVQRERGNGDYSRALLTTEQIDMLDEIGMVWNTGVVRERAWESMYASVSKYWKSNGKLPVWPRNLKSQDGRNMSDWIGLQRTKLSKNKCSKKQADLLHKIGIYPWKSEGGEDCSLDKRI